MGPIPIVGFYCSLLSGCEPSVSFALVMQVWTGIHLYVPFRLFSL